MHTGGTFGMVPMPPNQLLAPDEVASHILTHVPELEKLAHITVQCVFNLDSADIQIDHWQRLARMVAEHLDDYDGFVIIHGTDSMVYTAAALSFMLRNLPRPVILTGSQRPLAAIRTDARTNLINSVELATHSIPEVAIFFGTRLYRGNRTVKNSSIHYDAFQSPNYPPLAEVGIDVHVFDHHRRCQGGFQLREAISPAVLAVRYFPGLLPEYLEYVAGLPVKAVVLEALGLGHTAVKSQSLVPWIKGLREAGKLVVITSQSRHGRVDLSRYENGLRLRQAGAVGAGDMTTEAAIVKLMHLLGQGYDTPEILGRRLREDLAGEITTDHG